MVALRLASQELGEGGPLVVLHGLFGSGRNWTGVARRLGENRRVHLLDLRNHGTSPWSGSMTYSDMVADVVDYVADRGLGPIELIGHSMGGKVAMLLALGQPAAVGRLVVVDVAPVGYAHSHLSLVAAMQSVDLDRFDRRAAVDQALSERIPEAPVRQFLLQNLIDQDGRLRWRINLPVLAAHMVDIAGFPEVAREAAFTGPALFLAGGRSDYLLQEHQAPIRRLFPKARFETIAGAGHWVHAEQPEAFLRHVRAFLDGPPEN